MQLRDGPRINTQIYAEACEWLLEFRLEQTQAAARGAFDRWIRRSPEHLAAYLEAAAVWNEGPTLDPGNRWDAGTLVREAAQDDENVVSLAPAEAVGAQRGRRIRWRWGAIAASIGLVVCSILIYGLYGAATYVTGTGEMRSVTLRDGSTVELNARSKLKVRFTERARSVELLAGQALFRVAADAGRPFTVQSDTARVRVVGTQFDVYRRAAGVRVTVLEGRVQIGGGTRADGTDFLSAGEQAIVTGKGVRRVAGPNLAAATAWTERQLIFDSASMAEVAEEFNRYNERQLTVRDPALYDFHVSGVFSSADPASLIRFLRERPGVRVTEMPREIRVEKNIHP